jgi:hypothetical protein
MSTWSSSQSIEERCLKIQRLKVIFEKVCAGVHAKATESDEINGRRQQRRRTAQNFAGSDDISESDSHLLSHLRVPARTSEIGKFYTHWNFAPAFNSIITSVPIRLNSQAFAQFLWSVATELPSPPWRDCRNDARICAA